jgi:hypothetical protein
MRRRCHSSPMVRNTGHVTAAARSETVKPTPTLAPAPASQPALCTHSRSVSSIRLRFEADREHGLPQLLVEEASTLTQTSAAAVAASSHRRGDTLGAQELAQRAIEPARPRGCPLREVRAGGHHSSGTLTAWPRAAINALGDQPAAGGCRELRDLEPRALARQQASAGLLIEEV